MSLWWYILSIIIVQYKYIFVFFPENILWLFHLVYVHIEQSMELRLVMFFDFENVEKLYIYLFLVVVWRLY